MRLQWPKQGRNSRNAAPSPWHFSVSCACFGRMVTNGHNVCASACHPSGSSGLHQTGRIQCPGVGVIEAAQGCMCARRAAAAGAAQGGRVRRAARAGPGPPGRAGGRAPGAGRRLQAALRRVRRPLPFCPAQRVRHHAQEHVGDGCTRLRESVGSRMP